MTVDRKALLVAVALLVVFGVAFQRFALAPKHQARADLDAAIATQQDSRDAALAQATQGRKALAGYRADYAAVVRLGKAVPATADTSTLVYELQLAARRAGVDFESLKVAGGGAADTAAAAPGDAAPALPAGAVAGPDGFAVLPLELTFSGDFFGVDGVLRRVRSFVRVAGDRVGVRGRLVVVDGFELAPGEDGFPDVTATVKARAFLLPAGQTATGLPEAAAQAATPSPDAAAQTPTPSPTPVVATGRPAADQ